MEENILTTSHRDGVTNYLSSEETTSPLKKAASVLKGRNELMSKIGKWLYATTVFEKITRMTFPLEENNLIFVSISSDAVRADMYEGGHKQIVEHVLNILSRDPTKE